MQADVGVLMAVVRPFLGLEIVTTVNACGLNSVTELRLFVSNMPDYLAYSSHWPGSISAALQSSRSS
jgi:hypothetical protein